MTPEEMGQRLLESAEVLRLNERLVEQHIAHMKLIEAYIKALDTAQHNYHESERMMSMACGWAFDAGLLAATVRCYWCKVNLGSDEKDILAHVAQCRNGIMGVAS